MGRSSSRDERSSRKKKDREDSSRRREKEDRHEKKSKKRSRDDSESGDSRRRRKKHRNREDEDRQRRKSDSRKDDKKKHRKESRKSESRAKVKVDKSRLSNLGERVGRAPEKLLDAENDYFQYHQHLWVYLYREEGKTFNELSSDEARKAFARFVERYNLGDLEAAYYNRNGLPPDALEETKTTRHAWSFHTTETENRSLHMVQEGVRKQTDYRETNQKATGTDVGKNSVEEPAVAPTRVEIAPQRSAASRQVDRAVNRRMRDHTLEAADDIGGGKKHGRERQLEKRKEVGDRTHAASRERDSAYEINDEALYGDKDKSSFESALERQRRWKAKQEETKTNRLAELKKKEEGKREAMLKSLGLSGIKPGEKIKIAPRPESG